MSTESELLVLIIGLFIVLGLMIMSVVFVYQYSPLLGKALICYYSASCIAEMVKGSK